MRRPSRRLILGFSLGFLAGIQTAVVALDVVLRHVTPVGHHPTAPHPSR